jgi:hypothetical protein
MIKYLSHLCILDKVYFYMDHAERKKKDKINVRI